MHDAHAQHHSAQHHSAHTTRCGHGVHCTTCCAQSCRLFPSCTCTVSTRHVIAASSPVCTYLLLRRFWVSVVLWPCWLMSLFLDTCARFFSTDTTDELGLSAVPGHFVAKDALELGYFFFFVWDLWTTSVSAGGRFGTRRNSARQRIHILPSFFVTPWKNFTCILRASALGSGSRFSSCSPGPCLVSRASFNDGDHFGISHPFQRGKTLPARLRGRFSGGEHRGCRVQEKSGSPDRSIMYNSLHIG